MFYNFFRFFILFQICVYITPKIDRLTFNSSLNIILFNDTCIYNTEGSNIINKMHVESDYPQNVGTISNIKNKTLLKISNEDFIIFGFNEYNNLEYNKSSIKDNSNEEKIFREIGKQINGNIRNYTIKFIKPDIYLLYYIMESTNLFYSYILYISGNGNNDSRNKVIQLENNYLLNTIECDSYDAINIFCVYSIIENINDLSSYSFSTISYYSFENINNQELGKNELKRNIAGPTLLKIENNGKKQFLVCYYENKQKNPAVYCQYFTQKENEIIIEKLVLIGTSSYSQVNYFNFKFQNLIHLEIYGYTIYILSILQRTQISKTSVLFIASLDLNLIIPFDFSSNSIKEKNNLLVSDDYILFLTNENIEITNLEVKCPKNDFHQFFDNTPNIDLKHMSDNIQNLNQYIAYVSFDLDPLTILYTDDNQNMGGLLYMYLIKDYNNIKSNINLVFNKNLRITYNYFIYHSQDLSGVNDVFPVYRTFSNFCRFKVLYCYKSCANCNQYIIGTEELHQCQSCKNDYFEYKYNLIDTNYFNCYKKDENIVANNYYLDNRQYYKCDISCFNCPNNQNCSQCAEGYYYKEDEYQRDKTNFPCYKTLPSEYYLELNSSPKVYKKCYHTCSTCYGEGNENNNRCIKCKYPYINYSYDTTKCTTNISNCIYWKINETNNVQCLDQCDDESFIINGDNYPKQCVKDCQSYINPLNLWTNEHLLSYSCNKDKYCISPTLCEIKRWESNLTSCYINTPNDTDADSYCFNVSDPSPPPTVILTTEFITTYIEEEEEEEPLPSPTKITIVKYFEYNDTFNSGNFTRNQIRIYKEELKSELDSNKNKYEINDIDFITLNNYIDFNLTIYPLCKEDYVYKKLLKTNNLCFINFTQFFTKIHQNCSNIIIALIEFPYVKGPLNIANYFFFEYDPETQNYSEIYKENLTNDDSYKLITEYPLKNFENSNITEINPNDLINTIKTLYAFDPTLDFYKETNESYTDICNTFTSEVGTDMTIADRIERYSTKISFCENRCNISEIIDRGKEENPRSVCHCYYKKDLVKNENDYTLNYEKTEGKNVSNLNVLKCAKNVFNKNDIKNNFVFWIFLFLIIIILIIIFGVIFCGKTPVGGVLKMKKEEGNETEENDSKEDIPNISDKISSDNSGEKFRGLEFKDKKNKEIISSKISYSVPPKKKKEIASTKTNHRLGSKSDSNSLNTTINFNNRIELKFKKEDEIYDEIFPDYNEVLNNNYYENKYMKNNYINLRLKNLKIKKYFLIPLTKEDYINHNHSDYEDNIEEVNNKKKIKKRNIFSYYKKLMPKGDISGNVLKKYYETIRWETEYDLNNKKNVLKKSGQSFEESDSNFLGDSNHKKRKRYIKNSNNSNDSENKNDNIYIHKRKKSSLSSNNSNIKSSEHSSARSINKNKSLTLDKYFLNSSNDDDNTKVKYKFYNFFWIYLNKREFCLVSLYNMQDNVVSYIRISTFIFVASLIFSVNCLFLTNTQIHERYIYVKEKGSLNEFKYIFQKEFGTALILAVISLVIKTLFIKLIYGILFKISYSAKEDLSPFGFESEKDNKEDKSEKRKGYLKKYRKRSLIYISIILILMILLGYISICYFGIFINTREGMIARFFISFIFSFIFCAALCLIIVSIYHCGRKNNNMCFKITFRICRIIY